MYAFDISLHKYLVRTILHGKCKYASDHIWQDMTLLKYLGKIL